MAQLFCYWPISLPRQPRGTQGNALGTEASPTRCWLGNTIHGQLSTGRCHGVITPTIARQGKQGHPGQDQALLTACPLLKPTRCCPGAPTEHRPFAPTPRVSTATLHPCPSTACGPSLCMYPGTASRTQARRHTPRHSVTHPGTASRTQALRHVHGHSVTDPGMASRTQARHHAPRLGAMPEQTLSPAWVLVSFIQPVHQHPPRVTLAFSLFPLSR